MWKRNNSPKMYFPILYKLVLEDFKGTHDSGFEVVWNILTLQFLIFFIILNQRVLAFYSEVSIGSIFLSLV